MESRDLKSDQPIPAGSPEFWDDVRSSRSRFLGLDYDGTLAPFNADRMKAIPLQGVTEILQDIMRKPATTVAIFSGRPVAEVLTLLGDPDLIVSGSHGFEVRDTHGRVDEFRPTALQRIGLERGMEAASLTSGKGDVEVKIASIAVHTRPLAPEEAGGIEDALISEWTEIAGTYELECMRFNGGVELRSKGRDKGTVLASLLRMHPSDLAVYIGDDETDEDAFEVVREIGYGIRVGEPGTTTMAGAWLADPAAVRDFLREWVQVIG
jgi:trehalose 6-phosphate phosphatase